MSGSVPFTPWLIVTILLSCISSHAADSQAAQKLSFVPVADAGVMNAEVRNVNAGSSESMGVLLGRDNIKESYVKFEVKGITAPVRKAVLKVYVNKITKGDPAKPAEVWSTDGNWEEMKITWNNKPQGLTKVASFSTIPVFNTWMHADVTNHVKGDGVYSFQIVEVERADLVVATRETGEFSPVLEIQFGEGELEADSASQPVKASKDVTLNPVSDLWLDQSSSSQKSETLTLRGGDRAAEAYIAFDLKNANGDVNSARLRLHCVGAAGADSAISIYTTDNAWTQEQQVDWAQRPVAVPDKPLAEMKVPAAEGWVEFDVANYITGTGRFSFIIRTDSPAELKISSALAGESAPQLVVNHQEGLNERRAEVIKSGERILERYSDRDLARDGILDVTKGPYNADNTGKMDATLAIQRALHEGRESMCITYLPAGTYLVSDTLEGIEHGYEGGGDVPGGVYSRRDLACVLRGPADPKTRALIKLADNAPGFGDPEKPKAMIRFFNVIGTPPNVYEKSNANFSQQITDLDVDTNGLNGNAGAIGIDFLACEGTAFQCVKINAEGSFAGIKHGLGSGGGMHDLTVTGGQYGAYIPVSQPTCSLSNATFKGQTVACIFNNSRGPLIMPGAVLQPAAGANAIICRGGDGSPYNAGLALIDSRIEMHEGAREPAIQSDRSVYLDNVYVKNAATLLVMKDAGKGYEQPGKADGWLHAREYAANAIVSYDKKREVDGQQARPDVIYVNGERRLEPLVDILTDGITDPGNLQERHTWKGIFPFIDTPGILNAADYGADPAAGYKDEKADQWAALQKAIDEASAKNVPLFIPRGLYPISRTLDLKANTQLIGNQASTAIIPIVDPKVNADGDFLDDKNPQPLIRTVDDAKAATLLGFLRVNAAYPSAYAILWQAGEDSVIRSVRSTTGRGDRSDPNSPLVVIRGNGGGRYYVAGLSSSLVEGTTQPLRFYHYQVQPEGALLRNASNIEVYGMKYEGSKPVIVMENCSNVRIYGEGGGGYPKAVYKVTNSKNYSISNIHPQFGGILLGERDMVMEDGKGTGDSHQVLL